MWNGKHHQISEAENNKIMITAKSWKVCQMIFTFLICKHLAVSVKPTISSGEHTLINGKSEFLASCAAKVVFPAFGGPSKSTDTKPTNKSYSIN